MDIRGLGCALTGPELLQRVNDWRQVAAQAKSRMLQGNTVISVYPQDPVLVAELERLIEAERNCCSFMKFEITESPTEILVELRVPEEMRHVLTLMIGLATDAASLTTEGTPVPQN